MVKNIHLSGNLKYTNKTYKTHHNIKHICFNGGGILGVAYPGVIKVLEDNGIYGKIENFSGASAGAMMALLCALGYNSTEMMNFLHKTNFEGFMDSGFLDLSGLINGDYTSLFSLISVPEKLVELLNNGGICEGKFVKEWFENVIMSKGYDPDITFKDLYNETGLGLFVMNCNLSTTSANVRSHIHSPDMKVTTGCTASMSIPLIYYPIIDKENGDCLVDGGTTFNYPITLFDVLDIEGETLGFVLNTKESVIHPKHNKINNLVEVLTSLIATFRNTSLVMEFAEQKNIDRTVFIDTKGIDFLDFSLSPDEMNSLVSSGYNATNEYFNL